MAKKKKTTKVASATSAPTEAATTKNSPAKKVTKSTARKKTARKSVAKRGGGRENSVDTLLEKYENQRKSLEAELAKSKKEIADCEQKVSKLQQQISKLNDKVTSAESDLGQLGARRDAEIAKVLSKLGVQLSAPATDEPAKEKQGNTDPDEQSEAKTETPDETADADS